MKIKKKSSITASSRIIGTTFYEMNLYDAIDAIKEHGNIWVAKALAEFGWNCVNLQDDLCGSRAIGDTLYVCVTDGNEISINGELVDPETVLEDYELSDIEHLIEPADGDDIVHYITEWDIDTPNFNKLAPELIAEGYKFTRLVSDYEDFDV